MCAKHWRMVPKAMKADVARHWLRPADRPPEGVHGWTSYFDALTAAESAVEDIVSA